MNKILLLIMIISYCVWVSAQSYDPTKRPEMSVIAQDVQHNLADIHLNMIYFSKTATASYAVINKHYYHQGDTLGLYTVTAIDYNKVILTRAGQEYTVVLNKPLNLNKSVS